ncbi:hypothetical protein Dimus_005629, partial [Dionaea muscipula]
LLLLMSYFQCFINLKGHEDPSELCVADSFKDRKKEHKFVLPLKALQPDPSTTCRVPDLPSSTTHRSRRGSAQICLSIVAAARGVEHQQQSNPKRRRNPGYIEKGKTLKIPDISEATHESASVKEPASQGSALLAEEEVQQRWAD